MCCRQFRFVALEVEQFEDQKLVLHLVRLEMDQLQSRFKILYKIEVKNCDLLILNLCLNRLRTCKSRLWGCVIRLWGGKSWLRSLESRRESRLRSWEIRLWSSERGLRRCRLRAERIRRRAIYRRPWIVLVLAVKIRHLKTDSASRIFR